MPELLTISCQRTIRVADARPCRVDVDRHPRGKRGSPQALAGRLRENCTSAEGDHRGGARQRLRDDLLLDPPELRLPALEELADRAEALLDLLVRVDERAVREPRELAADRRLPRPHEADEGEVLVYRADHGMRSR